MSTRPVIQFSEASHDDALFIVNAVREGFSGELLDLMIYGSVGIGKFVCEQIALQNEGGDIHYTVARCDGIFAGAAEFRRLQEGLFLNYIAIMPAFRNCGLGTLLLREAISMNSTSQRGTIALDVLDHNVVARRWYERLGFCVERRTNWWTSPIARSGQRSPVSVENYPQAQACQREYGFSRFRLTCDGIQYEIGRLGETWYRITDPTIFDVSGIVDQLGRLDAGRRLLLLAPDSWTPADAASTLVAQTWRLTAPVCLVLENLERLIREQNRKSVDSRVPQGQRMSA